LSIKFQVKKNEKIGWKIWKLPKNSLIQERQQGTEKSVVSFSVPLSGIQNRKRGCGKVDQERTATTGLAMRVFDAMLFLAFLIALRAKREPTAGMVAPPGMSKGTGTAVAVN
jgi:hypothetical protein